jgi:hypothetical protein
MQHRENAFGRSRIGICAQISITYLCLILILILQCLNLSIVAATATPAKTLNVGLRASWQQTPLLYEAAEHMASIDDKHYWQFIDAMIDDQRNELQQSKSNQIKPVTDKQQYTMLTKISQSILGAASHQQLLFSIWNRVHSARLAAYQQFLSEELIAAQLKQSMME